MVGIDRMVLATRAALPASPAGASVVSLAGAGEDHLMAGDDQDDLETDPGGRGKPGTAA
jgi:hypothetical protein